MRKIFLFILLVQLPLVLWAFDRTEQEMRAIAQEQLAVQSLSKGKMPMNGKELLSFVDNSNFSIYGYEEGGMVVISRDNSFPAVLGYSDSRYQKSNMPSGFNWWMQAVSFALENSVDAGLDRNKVSFSPVDRMILAQWGQNDPYNYYSPEENGKKCPSGCVATAMSQIMYYYKYPASGKGTGYYTVGSSATHHTVSISTAYDWENMYPKYTYDLLTDANREAVGKLLHEAAASCNMNFSAAGSGTQSIYAASGLVDNFSYDASTLRFYTRDYYNKEEWMQMIYDELAQNHPIYYAGADASHGGHAFIFDGVDANGLVHVNWGWDGTADGYFAIDLLNPNGILGGNYTYGFNLSQDMIIGIRPQETPEDCIVPSQFYMENEFTVMSIMDRSITVSWKGYLYNACYRPFNGKLFIQLQNVDDASEVHTYTLNDNSEGGSMLPYYSANGLIDASKFYFEPNLKANATYRLAIYSQGKNETEPQQVRTPAGLQTMLITLNEAGKVVDITTGIESVTVAPSVSDNRIYNLNGVSVGTDTNSLPSGIYIKNGKKFVK